MVKSLKERFSQLNANPQMKNPIPIVKATKMVAPTDVSARRGLTTARSSHL
ncbi:MAG: hypothetical protein NZ921_00145 [Candidatus Caldarchaeum sp.]|nr:hypothetical protein [Candidatus Caldarchaeum sp.]